MGSPSVFHGNIVKSNNDCEGKVLISMMVPLAIVYQVAPFFLRGVSCGFCGIENVKQTTGLRIAARYVALISRSGVVGKYLMIISM